MNRFFIVCVNVVLLFASGNMLSAQTNDTETPAPADIVSEQGQDIVNILLLGSDTSNPQNEGRTDVIIIVSINRTADAVSFLSIPRDLWVYIPDWQMQRINTAYSHGENDGAGGSGVELLKDTILYNLGVEIDYYARVDFVGFREIVNALGGVNISVDCAIQDWRLRAPNLDPNLEESWEIVTLPVGVHHMDGDTALWYVRSRRTSSDFDRGRRQQDMLRAIWRRANELGLMHQIPELWEQITEVAQTDLSVADFISMLPVGLTLQPDHIAWYTFQPNVQVTFWQSPEGASVLRPVPDAINELVQVLMLSPTEHQIARDHLVVEIVNTSGIQNLETVAADRLAREGYITQIGTSTGEYRLYTLLVDYTGSTKGSSLSTLTAILRLSEESITQEPTTNRTIDYRIYLGNSYYSCTYGVLSPEPMDNNESE